MLIAGNSIIFILLVLGMFCLTEWLWEVGVEEVVVYTRGFLEAEARKVRVQTLPEVTSRRAWDKLELLLYYSGIRNKFPFLSAKVWLIGMFAIGCVAFLLGMVLFWSVWESGILCAGTLILLFLWLEFMRRINQKQTERYLLELLNLTESFAATEEEPLMILRACSSYLKGPVGQALRSIERYLSKGWSSGMILAQLKVMLEHPKWQEFIHNLSVCSMYNGEFSHVFRSSRNSIQSYLSVQKERQSVKRTARMEMFLITVLGMVIIVVLGNFLQLSVEELLWGNIVGKCCTLYMVGILCLFFWKMGACERE